MKVLFYPAISLDGFIAKLDGDSNWVKEEDEQIFADEVRRAGCVIVGRKTFEQYQNIYPIADTTTFVCTSSSARTTDGANTQVKYVGGAVKTVLEQIQAAGFSTAVLSGGAETNGRFAEALCIDEILVSIYPHFLGCGLPMFGNRKIQLRLELLHTRQLGDGVIQNRYEVSRS